MSNNTTGTCTCHETGPRFPHMIDERYIGRDETNGRFADVELIRCTLCRALWVKYLVEYEGFTKAGRWGMALIEQDRASIITAEEAPAYIEGAPWLLLGGSYFGHAGRRGVGWVLRDL